MSSKEYFFLTIPTPPNCKSTTTEDNKTYRSPSAPPPQTGPLDPSRRYKPRDLMYSSTASGTIYRTGNPADRRSRIAEDEISIRGVVHIPTIKSAARRLPKRSTSRADIAPIFSCHGGRAAITNRASFTTSSALYQSGRSASMSAPTTRSIGLSSPQASRISSNVSNV